jgi:hypothetical protein
MLYYIYENMEISNMRTIKKQKGFGMIMAIFLIVSIVMSLTGYLYQQSSKAYTDFYQTEESRVELITKIQDELRKFYIAHADDMSSESLPAYIDEEYIKNNLRLPSRSSAFIQIGISDARTGNSLRWRNIYAWLPATDGLDNSSFNEENSFDTALTPGDGVVWTAYSGRSYESVRLSNAQEQLESIANKMQSMFVANVAQDFFRNMEVNYFAGCEDRPPYANALPSISCSPEGQYIPMGQTNAQETLGLASTSFKNPWGKPIYIANRSTRDSSENPIPTPININGRDVYVNSGEIPFSAVLVSETPVDGEEIYLIVSQIL